MRISGFPAGMFQTNCYVIAGDGTDCVVVDPGQDAAAPLAQLLDETGLRPVAVLLTHGHLDHTWNLAQVCDRYDIPVYIHPADRHMLADPASGIGPQLGQFITDETFEEPDTVIELTDGEKLDLAGLEFEVLATPGHTQGSVCFHLPTETSGAEVGVVVSGDTLFAGSVGRSDLPGGDHEQLIRSIGASLLPLDDAVAVLPGHGPATSIGAERASNPFLS